MRRFLLILAACAALGLAGCATLPPPADRTVTTALSDTADTRLGRALAPQAAEHPGATGVHPLTDPRDAFAARILLAGAADRSLDVQYYIWHGDEVGYLMFQALWQAAERGVRVRLLLDDFNTDGLDATLAALDAHPNVEVRLYNPFAQRSARALALVGEFERLNRRMHNKSFTVDNQMAVVGGRNIGNEYFGAGTGVVFADLDVALVGAAVRAVSSEFDTYWNSASAYPAAPFVGAGTPADAEALEQRFRAARAAPASVAYLDAVAALPMLRDIVARRLSFTWTQADVISDDPAKTLDTAGRTDVLLFPELVRRMGQPSRSFELVSPYFVPGEQGTATLAALAERGVAVRILTNSLASTDEKTVHSGYAKRRVALLRAGVRLFELKPSAVVGASVGTHAEGTSSSSGLHAKTFAVDGERIFVGSFNFDQRSARLNTEMGVVISDRALAQALAAGFDDSVPQDAYEVRLREDGRSLEWIERTADGERRYDTEPGTTWLQRRAVETLSVLPIEWLL